MDTERATIGDKSLSHSLKTNQAVEGDDSSYHPPHECPHTDATLRSGMNR